MSWASERDSHYFRLVSLYYVFIISILRDLDLLCVAAYRAAIEMGEYYFSLHLSSWYRALFLGAK